MINENEIVNENIAHKKTRKARKIKKTLRRKYYQNYKTKLNTTPLTDEIQSKILTSLKNGLTLPYIRASLHINKDNIYFKELIDKYNNNQIDVNSIGDLFVPPTGTIPPIPVSITKKYVDDDDNNNDDNNDDNDDNNDNNNDNNNNNNNNDNGIADKLNEKDDEKMLTEIKNTLINDNTINIKSKQKIFSVLNKFDDNTKSLNINNAYNNIDKNKDKLNKSTIKNGVRMSKNDVKMDTDNENEDDDNIKEKNTEELENFTTTDDDNLKEYKKIFSKSKSSASKASLDDIANDSNEILNKYPNISLIHNILVRLNLSPVQIKTIILKYMSSSYSIDKNPEILFPTMIAMGVSQPKANLIINDIKATLFGTPDDYTSLNMPPQNPNTVNNPNNPNNKPSYMVNYDKTANGYAPNNQPPVPIDPEELEQRQQSKAYRKRMNEMIAQAMETTTMMKIINASNTPPPPVAPVTPVGSIIRQTPLLKDGAVVKDEYGNVVYITETVPVNSNVQTIPAENPEIKEIKEAIISLANEIKNNNKPPVTKNDDALTNTMISYFKDVANKSIDEKKEMESKYYNSLFTLLSENKKEVENKLKLLEQNSDPMTTIKYFNDIKKVIGSSDGNPNSISAQLEIEKLKAQTLRESEKNRLDFERWKEEQRMRAQEKAEELQAQRELKQQELMFAKQTADKNLSEMDKYMNFGKNVVDQFTPIAKEAMQGFIDAKSGVARTVVKTDKEPGVDKGNNTLDISQLSDSELEQVINNSNYVLNKYNNEVIPAVKKELERRKSMSKEQ